MWFLVTTAVTALRPLHQSWDAYNNRYNLSLSTCAPPPLNNQANQAPNPLLPCQNVNNFNCDDCVIGEEPLAKKVWKRPTFAVVIKAMND